MNNISRLASDSLLWCRWWSLLEFWMTRWTRSSPFLAWVFFVFFMIEKYNNFKKKKSCFEGLFVLIQIAVTSVAVVAVLLIDKFKSVSKRHRQYTHNLDLRTHFQPRKISPLRDHSVSNLGRTLTSTDALHTIFCVAHWKFCVANVQSGLV